MAGLQFSNTTSRELGLVQDCEDLLNFPATGISANTNLLAQFTRNMNAWYNRVVTMILESQDSWDFDDSNNTDYPIGTIPLTIARDVTIPISSKILKIKRMDVTYDGSTWYKAELLDTGQIGTGLGNDTNTDGNFSKTKPFYDLVGSNGVFIYPLASAADVTAGAKMRVEFYRDITEFVVGDTTKQPGFDAPFHKILSLGASYDYARANGLSKKDDLMMSLQDLEGRLKRYYGQKVTDSQFTLSAAYITYE